MATYKLIQDIEAEDKILGPLTLRQFIFALIAAFLFYLCFISVVRHWLFLLVIFLPPALFFGFFALPFGRDQPTEVWALAKLRFWFKPRRRVWNQSGVKELVTITVPKKVERILTNGLSQTEVKSRLQALAETIDSRGWAIKHAGIDAYTPTVVGGTSDRLIGLDSLPQEVPNTEVAPDDIMDENSSPIARQFNTMINQSSQARRQDLVSQLAAGAPVTAQPPAAAGWFTGQGQTAVPAAAASPDDSGLAARLAARTNSRQVSFGNLRTVRPLTARTAVTNPAPTTGTGQPAGSQTAPVTASDDPAILSLARNDDLNVATLARQAQKNRAGVGSSPDEVVIPLH